MPAVVEVAEEDREYESESDSGDAELEAMFGRPDDNKKVAVKDPRKPDSSSEEEDDDSILEKMKEAQAKKATP